MSMVEQWFMGFLLTSWETRLNLNNDIVTQVSLHMNNLLLRVLDPLSIALSRYVVTINA